MPGLTQACGLPTDVEDYLQRVVPVGRVVEVAAVVGGYNVEDLLALRSEEILQLLPILGCNLGFPSRYLYRYLQAATELHRKHPSTF